MLDEAEKFANYEDHNEKPSSYNCVSCGAAPTRLIYRSKCEYCGNINLAIPYNRYDDLFRGTRAELEAIERKKKELQNKKPARELKWYGKIIVVILWIIFPAPLFLNIAKKQKRHDTQATC